jgi:uncharacterized protein YbjT (DUF2867 family)
MKKAILLGASGLIGSHILKLLLADDRYGSVITIVRRELPIQHPKLKQAIGDLFDMPSFGVEFQGADDLFIAIGTTRAKTPDKKMYEAIDYGIPLAAAKMAAKYGIAHVAVVSSMGANAKSSIFYAALKGRMEDDIQRLGIKYLVIVRPSLLLGKRDESRTGERLAALFMTKLDFFIPAKHKAIQGSDVARAMLMLVNRKNQKTLWLNNELHLLTKASYQ